VALNIFFHFFKVMFLTNPMYKNSCELTAEV